MSTLRLALGGFLIGCLVAAGVGYFHHPVNRYHLNYAEGGAFLLDTSTGEISMYKVESNFSGQFSFVKVGALPPTLK